LSQISYLVCDEVDLLVDDYETKNDKKKETNNHNMRRKNDDEERQHTNKKKNQISNSSHLVSLISSLCHPNRLWKNDDKKKKMKKRKNEDEDNEDSDQSSQPISVSQSTIISLPSLIFVTATITPQLKLERDGR